MTDLGDAPAPEPGRRWRIVRIALVATAVLAAVYYPLGMLYFHQINDDPAYQPDPAAVAQGGSRAVAVTADLIDREVNRTHWVANDPWFVPSALLDNMPNYQMGMVGALARFAFELTDQLGRSRGSSQVDPDLQEASGALQYSGTKWVIDLSTSIWPTATSEDQYNRARRALLNYNARLARGEAVFDRRSDNLQATLDRIALDLGSSSAALDRRIAEHAGDLIDTQADDLFYGVKGQAYAYYMLLQALRADFEGVIRDRDVGRVYDAMLDSLRSAATLSPLVVVNAQPDSFARPSHLASIGFYLLRSRTQLREITQILQR